VRRAVGAAHRLPSGGRTWTARCEQRAGSRRKQHRFDRITRLVRSLLGAPTALISLVDRERQFFKSTSGLGEPGRGGGRPR
jgi:hypothetical protein